MRKEPTQQQKVLQILIRDGGWIPTYEFQNRCGIFLGHRGPARISELANEFPEMIQTDKSDRIYKYRFRFDNVHVALEAYAEWKAFMRVELEKAGRTFKQYKTVYQPVPGENAVRPVRVLV